MREERPDASLFIGLHKLAAQNGDGLVPELYALLTERAEPEHNLTNVVALPTGRRNEAGDVLPEGPAKILNFRR